MIARELSFKTVGGFPDLAASDWNSKCAWYMMPCMACSDRLCIILIYVHNVVDTVRRHFSQVCCTDNIKHFIVHTAC